MQIQQFLQSHNPSLLSITETYKTQCNIKHMDYITYDLAPTNLPINTYHSTNQSVLIHRDVPHNLLDSTYHIINSYLSMHWFRIRTGATTSDRYTLVCSIYRSPNPPPDTNVWSLIASNISIVTQQFPNMGILLLGDINARLKECGDAGGASNIHPIYSSITCPHKLHIINTILAYGSHTHTYTNTSTTKAGIGTSITDLAIANARALTHCESMSVLDQSLFDSDHRCIVVTLTGPVQFGVPATTVPHLRFRKDKLDTTLFQLTMDDTAAVLVDEFNRLLDQGTQQSLNKALSIIHSCYSVSSANSCPKTLVKPGQNPWWNKIPNRDALRGAFLLAKDTKNRHPRNRAADKRYHLAREAWNTAIRIAKDTVFTQFVTQLDANPSLPESILLGTEQVSRISLKRRLWWSFYKRTKPSEFGAAMVMNSTGDLPIDQQESLNNLATAFANISQVKPDTNAFHARITVDIEQIEEEASHDHTSPLPFTMADLDLIFNKIPSSAAGGDDIHTEFMHATPQSVRSMVFRLYTAIWETGILPEGFTEAKVVPLYKGDGSESRAQSNNYRPISITSLLIRALERLLRPMYNGLILPHITKYQSGFRPGFSTMDNIHRAVDYIYRVIRERKYSLMLSIDLTKAFDTVWVEGLLHTLWHRFHVRGRAWRFIKAFLSNRTMYVVGQNRRSILRRLSAGVPQGSVLAPLLFLAYIDLLAQRVSPYATLALYADDALAWPRVMGEPGIFNILSAASKIYDWSIDYKLTIHQTKSTLLRISNRRSMPIHHWPILQLMTGDGPCRTDDPTCIKWTIPYADSLKPFTNTLKVLGITVQGNGRWTAQATQLTARVSSLAHTISRLSTRDGPPQPISIYTVTRAVILSTIMYGFCMWRPTQTAMYHLQSLLAMPLKRVLVQSSRSVSTLGILAEYGIPPLHILRQGQLLTFFHKQLTIPSHITHLSRDCAVQQRSHYLTLKHTKQSAFVRSLYMEAEQSAAAILPLHTLHPAQWTNSTVRSVMATAATHCLLLSSPGRKALNLCNPYSAGLFQPQFYLSHELKPSSSARARLRLDIALTPVVLHRYNHTISPHCRHCQHSYADRTHLILHCPHYAASRQTLRQAIFRYTQHPLKLNLNIALHAHDEAISSLRHELQLNILLASSTLLLDITKDLPTTTHTLHHE